MSRLDFSDLEGDLDRDAYQTDEQREDEADAYMGEPVDQAARIRAQVGETFLEAAAGFRCQRCGGSGHAFGGVCFRCKGSGKQKRAPDDYSPQAVQKRAAAKSKRMAAAQRAQDDLNAQIAAWRAANPAVDAWIMAAANRGSNFGTSLLSSLLKWGSLTERQGEAVARIVAQDAEKAAARAAEVPASPATGLDLSAVPAGTYAVPGGDTRLKVKIQKPRPPSKWAGYIFVSDGAVYGSAKRYGSQRPGSRYQGQILEALQTIAQDPKAAMAAYGKLTSTCGVCGRPLEDPESVERGIGPVCAGRFE